MENTNTNTITIDRKDLYRVFERMEELVIQYDSEKGKAEQELYRKEWTGAFDVILSLGLLPEKEKWMLNRIWSH